MEHTEDQLNPGLSAGDRIGGYELRRVAPLPVINAVCYELHHAETDARHIHVSRDDAENVFGVAFKTVPEDSTGVAHILEHTALCGSRKFPVRDPFFSMIKRSLNTFMNAFTASDWTMYPFATQNPKDFGNLLDVYLDAAFFPNLERLNFLQEGHRLDFEEDGRLVYRGVVFNEMKGAMSSPDQVMVRYLMNALYPDTTYGNNSGGEPSDIPKLTHEALLAFHRRHYHPSNSYFFTYGNLPLRGHLDRIEENVLRHFARIDPHTDVPNQPRWDVGREVTRAYPLDPSENPEKKSQSCLAWLTADIQDTYEVMVMALLGQILLGNPAAPLRTALLDSGLGSALSDGSGYDADNRDTMFVAGLKDVREADAPAVERIVLDTLEAQVRNGVDRELVEAAIHQMEFHRREVSNSPYPYGLKLLVGLGGTWFHGGDPARVLRFDDDLARLRLELEQGTPFEDRIRAHLLDNPHRVRFTLVPDTELAARETERERAELREIQARLTDAEAEQIRADAAALESLQEEDEDLSVLPTLELTDIPPSVPSVDPSEPQGAAPATWFEQPTSGILYFTAAAGCGQLPENLTPMLPFFCYALNRFSTARSNYTDLVRRIDRYTGGIGLSVHARTRYDGGDGTCAPFVTLSGKSLERNVRPLFEIIAELMREFQFTDTRRLRTLLNEYRANRESMIVRAGHSLAMSAATRNFSQTRALNEIWNGIRQYQTIKAITDDPTDERLAEVGRDLEAAGRHLFSPANLRVALIGEEAGLQAAAGPLGELLEGLPGGPDEGIGPPSIAPDGDIPREGWSTTSAVSFVARAFPAVRMGHPDAPALAVIARMLRSLYIHREIRERGGAYGGFALYNSEDGVFAFASYRDPHIVRTLSVYEDAERFIRDGEYDAEDVKESILQVCADIDRPDPPGQAARKAFYRRLIGLTDEDRKRFKEGLLRLTPEAIRATAGKYFGPDQTERAVAVVSGDDQLRAANGELGDRALNVRRI